MPQTPGDDRNEPQLELPSLRLPRLGRRRRSDESAPAAEPEPTPAPASMPAPEPEPERQPEREPEPKPEPAPEQAPAQAEPTPEPAAPARRADRKARVRPVPRISGWTAAAVTGVLVGAGGSAATYGAMQVCEVVRGVSTCGGTPGFLVLVAILVLMVLAGTLLLRALGTRDTLSTSFLAVGVVAVVVMLVLLDVIFSPWMFLVIPALGAASYLVAHWVSTRFAEEDIGRRDWT